MLKVFHAWALLTTEMANASPGREPRTAEMGSDGSGGTLRISVSKDHVGDFPEHRGAKIGEPRANTLLLIVGSNLDMQTASVQGSPLLKQAASYLGTEPAMLTHVRESASIGVSMQIFRCRLFRVQR